MFKLKSYSKDPKTAQLTLFPRRFINTRVGYQFLSIYLNLPERDHP